MKYDPHKHHRRRIRLPGYDYAGEGAYFLTLCTHNRGWLFGHIENGVMRLNPCGELVQNEWQLTAHIRPEIRLDGFVVMPNHFHAILWIVTPSPTFRPTDSAPAMRPYRPPKSLGSIVTGFKSTVTRQINQLRDTPNAPVWQRNYYEHIIRDESRLHEIRDYVRRNPAIWTQDKLYSEG